MSLWINFPIHRYIRRLYKSQLGWFTTTAMSRSPRSMTIVSPKNLYHVFDPKSLFLVMYDEKFWSLFIVDSNNIFIMPLSHFPKKLKIWQIKFACFYIMKIKRFVLSMLSMIFAFVIWYGAQLNDIRCSFQVIDVSDFGKNRFSPFASYHPIRTVMQFSRFFSEK